MTQWTKTRLTDKDCFEFLTGLWTGKTVPLEQAVVIRNTNFRNDGRLDLSDVAVLNVESRQLATKRLEKGDIIIERSGGGPKQPVGRVCFFNETKDEPYSFSNFTSTLRIKDKQAFVPLFVHYYLLHLYMDGFTAPLQRATTGIRNLDFGAYQQAKIPQPQRTEQKKIAALLWKLQRAIEVEEKLTASARELKQSAMRQLFTCGLHGETQKDTDIGPIPESWDAVPLETLARIGNGSTPLKRNLEYWVNGSIPWLTSAKVYDVTVTKADQFVTPKAVKECHLPRVKPGSVLMAITGQGKTLGNAAVTDIETCVSQHIAYMQFYDESANPHFIRLFLETRYEELRAIAQGGGSTKGALTCGFLKSYCVPLPRGSEKDRSEQDEVVRILMAIEEKIRIHSRKAETLQELFRTLLHQLMTGEIRVADLDIDVSEVTQ